LRPPRTHLCASTPQQQVRNFLNTNGDVLVHESQVTQSPPCPSANSDTMAARSVSVWWRGKTLKILYSGSWPPTRRHRHLVQYPVCKWKAAADQCQDHASSKPSQLLLPTLFAPHPDGRKGAIMYDGDSQVSMLMQLCGASGVNLLDQMRAVQAPKIDPRCSHLGNGLDCQHPSLDGTKFSDDSAPVTPFSGHLQCRMDLPHLHALQGLHVSTSLMRLWSCCQGWWCRRANPTIDAS